MLMGHRRKSGFTGPSIRRLRDERNWTQPDLVEAIRRAAAELGQHQPGVTVQMISRWENGKITVSADYQLLLEHAFARTMDLNDDSWEDMLNRRRFLTGTTSVGVALLGASLGLEPWQRLSATLQHRARTDQATVDNLETVTTTFSQLFQTVAPIALIAPVRSHLDSLTRLLTDGSLSEGLRRQLASLASESSILLGWITQDQGDEGVAQEFYLSALDAAAEAHDPAIGAYAIASASTLKAFRSSPSQSIHLLTDATVKGSSVRDASPSTRAWIYSLQAEAHVRDGDAADAFAALDAAQDVLDRPDSDEDRRPRSQFFDQARLVGERGVTAVRLHMPDVAEEPLAASIDGLASDPKTESRMLTHLARARLQQREVEEACRLAIRSLDVAQDTGSTIGIKDLHDFRQDLTPWRDVDAVHELDERLAVQL
jgi:transcriptional regulator with XRE-family HTH domain